MFKKNSAFFFRGLEDLRKEIYKLKLEIPLENDLVHNLSEFKKSLSIDGKKIPNRFCVQPMEGCDGEADGSPGELTFRRYKRFARGGAGLIWVEATAVTPEGKANPRQLYLNEKSALNFKKLVELIRENSIDYENKKQNTFIVLQLTHSGRYSKPEGKPAPIIFHHSPFLDPAHNLHKDYPLITDQELDSLQEKYVAAARIAYSCGFDAVDIKACHGYLVNEILSGHTRKDSKYGGNFKNRIRFFTEVIEKIKNEIPGLVVTTRMNVYDGIPYPYGWGMKEDESLECDLKEPLMLIEKINKLGVSIINVSFGNPYHNPHIERPYDYPVWGLEIPEEHPLRTIARNTKLTAKVSQTYPEMIVVATGFSWLRELFPYLGLAMLKNKYCDIIGLGRGALANPDFANEFLSTGKLKPEKTCITCSSCTQIMRDGGKSGCVIHDTEVYKQIYELGRLKDETYIREIAKACRKCWGAPCIGGCPAGLDIPRFIHYFSQGNLEDAYSIIKERNILSETCAYTCPAEVLCEQSCTAEILDRKTVPIHEIQKFIASEARKKGLTKVIPGTPKEKRIAVIGFGPAGISCSVRLIENGFKVCVFESCNEPGGLPTSVIPTERLPSGVLQEEVKSFKLEETGLFEIRYNHKISENFSIDDIFEEGFDSVFIAAGLNESVGLNVTEKPEGVISGLDFLKRIKNRKIKLPERASVIGGGNTAMDTAISLKENEVKDVYLIYRRSFRELPAWPKEIEKALKAGVHFLILSQPIEYLKDGKGKLKGIKIARTELGKIDSSGRRSPRLIHDSEYILSVPLCVEAIGQRISTDLVKGLKGVDIEKGKVKVIDGNYSTTRDKVFAGGDIINGGKTVVQAVKEGMEAAEQINLFLRRV